MHQQNNMDLQKGDLTTVCRPCFSMINSAKDGEEEAESSPNSNSLHHVGDLPNL